MKNSKLEIKHIPYIYACNDTYKSHNYSYHVINGSRDLYGYYRWYYVDHQNKIIKHLEGYITEISFEGEHLNYFA